MNKELNGIYRHSEDILNASTLVYDFCKQSDDEYMVKIRPIVELIKNKADKLCVKLLDMEYGEE